MAFSGQKNFGRIRVKAFHFCLPFYSIGIGMEGIGCILAGAWGSGNGTTSYSENVGAIGITKVHYVSNGTKIRSQIMIKSLLNM